VQQDIQNVPMNPLYSGPPDSHRTGAEARVAAALAPQIYLVDPDPLTRGLLVDYLGGKGFEVIAPTDMEATPPPVDVLIVALEGMEQRANRPGWLLDKPAIPVIVLDRSYVFPGRTAALGFQPYARLSLPIQPRKLVATIRQALSLARTESVDPREASVREYRFSGWTLHRDEHRLASPDGQSILLDKREFEVLRAFLMFPRQLLTRQQLIAIAWGTVVDVENRALDRPVTRLRRYLGDDAKFPLLLKTVVGVGYRLDTDVEKLL
jgi:two-component system, OmpR family, response regulator